MSSAPKAFVIHLERAAGRRPSVEALVGALPIESEILPAVDGRALSAEEADGAHVRSRYAPRYPFALARSEIGAFLSHRAAWRRIIDDGLDFAFVFEDDATIDSRRFAAALGVLQPQELVATLAGEQDALGDITDNAVLLRELDRYRARRPRALSLVVQLAPA